MRNRNHSRVAVRLLMGWHTAFVGGAVWMSSPALAETPSGDIATSVVDEDVTENSVLVATHKLEVPATDAADTEDELQPISALSENEPQLADPEPTLAPLTEEATADADDRGPLKVATKVSAVGTNGDHKSAEPVSQSPEPSAFHGIKPGVSTKKQLEQSWGSPDESAPTEAGQLLTYDLESFGGVDVLVEDGVVALLKVNLLSPDTFEALNEKIGADSAEAIEIVDEETGRVAAFAYPERGIVMVVDSSDDITPASTPMVSQMLLQPLDAETFCLRAAQRHRSELTGRLADLEQAVQLAPHDAYAHWHLAQALLDAGRADAALSAAKKAVELEPQNIAYRQRWGEALAATGEYDESVLVTREVLDSENAPTMVRAQALHQMGVLASLGDAEISEKAISFHSKAIAEADKLATSNSANERRAAKRLLVEAHLAIAVEISRREYDDKLNNVAQWVSRASAFAEEAIGNDNGGLDLRLRVAQQSLAALANFKPGNDPQPLIGEIVETLETIKSESDDPAWIEQLEWTTGVAYLSALQIEHHRHRPDQALEYSEKAIELLSDKAEQRRDNPATERLVGRLYFHIGAVHAVHRSRHAEAVEWYDRAFPLLTAQGPTSVLLVPRHEGEALVSMAVSYWDQNDKKRAISLTETGADLIEQAVAGGVIAKANLAVPYGNLAVMHKRLGNASESQRYASLAASAKQPDEAPQVDGAPASGAGVAAQHRQVSSSTPRTAQRATANRTSKSPTSYASPNRRTDRTRSVMR